MQQVLRSALKRYSKGAFCNDSVRTIPIIRKLGEIACCLSIMQKKQIFRRKSHPIYFAILLLFIWQKMVLI